MFKLIFMLFLYYFYLNLNNFMLMILMMMFFLNFYHMEYINMFNNLFFIDKLSFYLIYLVFWIIFLMLLSINKKKFLFLLMMNNNIYFLILSLMFSFSVMNFFFFYLFFEISLIPIFYLIMGWGYQPERIKAGLYLLFYTLFASLPLLINLLYLLIYNKSLDFLIFNFINLNLFLNNFFWFFFMLSFLVKMPMFLFHLWLPKAHVEAPVFGSMILAGILLKLGGYGIIRILMLLNSFKKLNLLIIIISLIGSVLMSMNCLIQLDLKILIAYSSVSHMGMLLSGLLTFSFWGINGGYLMMIGHGLCSSGLFCLSNLNYERNYNRSLLFNKGMINFIPFLSLWWFLLCSSNMSAPLSLNLFSEISLIYSLINYSKLNMIFLMLICFFSAAYSLYLYSFSQHGNNLMLIYNFLMINMREILLLLFHWFPLNILFLKIFLI